MKGKAYSPPGSVTSVTAASSASPAGRRGVAAGTSAVTLPPLDQQHQQLDISGGIVGVDTAALAYRPLVLCNESDFFMTNSAAGATNIHAVQTRERFPAPWTVAKHQPRPGIGFLATYQLAALLHRVLRLRASKRSLTPRRIGAASCPKPRTVGAGPPAVCADTAPWLVGKGGTSSMSSRKQGKYNNPPRSAFRQRQRSSRNHRAVGLN